LAENVKMDFAEKLNPAQAARRNAAEHASIHRLILPTAENAEIAVQCLLPMERPVALTASADLPVIPATKYADQIVFPLHHAAWQAIALSQLVDKYPQ
jgi:hypothetical protein